MFEIAFSAVFIFNLWYLYICHLLLKRLELGAPEYIYSMKMKQIGYFTSKPTLWRDVYTSEMAVACGKIDSMELMQQVRWMLPVGTAGSLGLIVYVLAMGGKV